MTFYFAMTNSWSLLYDELYGEDTMPEDKIDLTIGAGNTASAYTVGSIGDFDSFENISINTLYKNIDDYVEKYGPSGNESEFGKKSHNAYISALKKFKNFTE